MTTNQWGWFLFVAGLLVIIALLVGDLLTLWQSHGTVDMAFVYGMLAHVAAPALAFKGGLMILPHDPATVSDQTRADLSKEGL